MRATHFIAVGASAGGVESLRRLVGSLPAHLDAAVGIVLHVSPTSPSLLPQILGRSGVLPVTHAHDNEAIEPRHVYVAPPDRHLLVRDGRFVLDHGPTENGVRPAVDALFRSVAAAYGECAIGVVLSGSLDDGTAGLQAIKDMGGRAVVQDPADATHPDMPSSALKHVDVDCVAPAADIAGCLLELIGGPLCDPPDSGRGAEDAVGSEVVPEALTCPDCGGPLELVGDRPQLRLRCTVGHQWTQQAFDDAQARMLENALYSALRIVDERIALTDRMSDVAMESGHHRVVAMLEARRAELAGQAAHVRAALEHADRSLKGDEAP